MNGDEICGVCGEPRSAHVPTKAGPETHPAEARGEGRYLFVANVDHGVMCRICPGGICEGHTLYRFEPAKKKRRAPRKRRPAVSNRTSRR